MARGESPGARPWTVYVLVVASAAGLVWSLFLDSDRNAWFIVNLVVSLGLMYALWVGKSWAFSLSFMGASLCAVALVGVILIQLLLLEMRVPSSLWWGLLINGFWIVLLLRPETKRFAGLDRGSPAEGVPTGS